MGRTRGRVALATVALLLAEAGLTSGYVVNPFNWLYKSDPMGEPFLVNPNAADASAGSPEIQILSLIDAASAWTNGGNARFEFTYGGTTTKTSHTWDGTNAVYFSSGTSGNAVATTYIFYLGSNVQECDMVFWDGAWNFYGGIGDPGFQEFDIWNVGAHEFGHFLSLGHSSSLFSTMYYAVGYGETWKRDINADDRAGIQAIYSTPAVRAQATPAESLIVLPDTGGSFTFDVTIANNTGSRQQTQAWIDVILPSGAPVGPIAGPVALNLPAHRVITVTGVGQTIPDYAPAGTYAYNVKVGAVGGTVGSAATFPFIKEASPGTPRTVAGAPVLAARDAAPFSTEGWTVRGFAPDDIRPSPAELTSAPKGSSWLGANYPNPFSPDTRLAFTLGASAGAAGGLIPFRLQVFTLRGALVRTVAAGGAEPGAHEVRWDGRDEVGRAVAPGPYLVRLEVRGRALTRRIVLAH